MPFFQDPPRLGNQWDDDPLLQEYLARSLPPDLFAALLPEWRELGELGARLATRQDEDRANLPMLTQWDAWGRRIDRVEVSPLWREAARLAAERGLVAIAYERREGAWSRARQ